MFKFSWKQGQDQVVPTPELIISLLKVQAASEGFGCKPNIWPQAAGWTIELKEVLSLKFMWFRDTWTQNTKDLLPYFHETLEEV